VDPTSLIKSTALKIGFQTIGISAPEPMLEKHSNYLENWLKYGKNGAMHWLNNQKDKRKDIKKFYPEIKSIISVAMNYFTGDVHENFANSAKSFKFSNYAWGIDYHTILRKKLIQLLQFIYDELYPNAHGIICVDSAPVMEKYYAQCSGIGWQGKHTILINEELGSWFFLGEILLDITLKYDEPFNKNLCGDCHACIDACPTNALTEYKLDATKCISYLTVESKEKFSDRQKSALNGWLYGCDECQKVCPWNVKNQSYSNEKSFSMLPEIEQNTLADWMKIDEKEFNRIFANSTIKRLKYHRFRRNVEAVYQSFVAID